MLSLCCIALAHGQGTTKIDTAKSVIGWRGSNLFRFNEHFGTVKFQNGEISMQNDSVTDGKFEVDMGTIMNTDGKYNETLVDHLKGHDFFDIEKYPTAALEMTTVRYLDNGHLDIDAILTIKGIARSIKFQATVEKQHGGIVLESKFIIDRTRWGVNYEAKGLVGSLKDDIISDAIEFEVKVVAQ